MKDESGVRVIDAPRGAEVPPTVEAFLGSLGGPTLLRVAGRDRRRARALATLLHGNEPSGLRALHAWLRGEDVPAVDLVCFVANVWAARMAPGFAHRHLPGRPDWNRCFRAPFETLEGRIAHEALRLLREAAPDALLDVHNNTGHNPAYGVSVRADAASINLSALFGERLVVSDLRLGTLSEATADDFPTVTIECGRAGDPAADRAALEGLRRYAALERVETRHVAAERMQVLEEPVRVRVRSGIRFGFGDRARAELDFTISGDVDRHNFQTLLPGVPIGWVAPSAGWPVEAHGADGEEVSRDWFVLRDGLLETRRATVPIMMTTDAAVAASDCLFYVVRERERIEGRARIGR